MFNEYCDRLQNRLIFPAISSIFICLLYYVDQGYCRMIFAGFLFFFLMKEGKWSHPSVCYAVYWYWFLVGSEKQKRLIFERK